MLSSRPLGDPWVAWADHCVRPKSNAPFKTTHKEIEKKMIYNDIQELYPQTEDLSSIDPRHLVFAKKLWPDSRLRSLDEFWVMAIRLFTKECEQLQKGTQGKTKKVWFYVLFYSVWIQFRLNFL